MEATFKIESVKHYTFGVFVMIANTQTNEVCEMTFKYLQEAYDYIGALNKIGK
jgi:hypothetical protein